MNQPILELRGDKCGFCLSKTLLRHRAVPFDVSSASSILTLLECTTCGLAWQYPLLRDSQESKKYFSEKYETREEGSYFDSDKRVRIAETEVEFVESLFPKTGTLLDIGAGDGTFIRVAGKRGWRCTGIDPAASADFMFEEKMRGSAKLLVGSLDTLDTDLRADVITMWDVVEHVERPDDLILAAAPFLKPDGILVIETGNFQSVGRIMAGGEWWCYQADHRWYFSPEILVRLLKKCGFQHVVMATKTLRPWWTGTATYLGPSTGQTVRSILKRPFWVSQYLKRHQLLKRAGTQWHKWAGLEITTIAAARTDCFQHQNHDAYVRLT